MEFRLTEVRFYESGDFVRPKVGQSLNDRDLSVFVLCGRGLAWSMISACQCRASRSLTTRETASTAVREFKSRRPHHEQVRLGDWRD